MIHDSQTVRVIATGYLNPASLAIEETSTCTPSAMACFLVYLKIRSSSSNMAALLSIFSGWGLHSRRIRFLINQKPDRIISIAEVGSPMKIEIGEEPKADRVIFPDGAA